jgi:hypothetical protein
MPPQSLVDRLTRGRTLLQCVRLSAPLQLSHNCNAARIAERLAAGSDLAYALRTDLQLSLAAVTSITGDVPGSQRLRGSSADHSRLSLAHVLSIDEKARRP